MLNTNAVLSLEGYSLKLRVSALLHYCLKLEKGGFGDGGGYLERSTERDVGRVWDYRIKNNTIAIALAVAIASTQAGAEEVLITTADDGAAWMLETTSFKALEGTDGVDGDMIIYPPNNAPAFRFHMAFTDCHKSTGTYLTLEKDQPIRYGNWSYHGNQDDTPYALADLVGTFMCGARETYIRAGNDQR